MLAGIPFYQVKRGIYGRIKTGTFNGKKEGKCKYYDNPDENIYFFFCFPCISFENSII